MTETFETSGTEPLVSAIERLLSMLPQPTSRHWSTYFARLQIEEVRRELDKLKNTP